MTQCNEIKTASLVISVNYDLWKVSKPAPQFSITHYGLDTTPALCVTTPPNWLSSQSCVAYYVSYMHVSTLVNFLEYQTSQTISAGPISDSAMERRHMWW